MNRDQGSAIIFLIVGCLICLHSVSYRLGSFTSPGSGLMPFLAGMAICVLAGIGLIDATFKKTKEGKEDPLFKGVKWRRILLTLTALLGYLLALKPLGFFLCTALFIAFSLRIIVPHRWAVAVGAALLTATGSYAIFELWLRAQLPKGPFGI
jgi:amino acid transporter